MITLSIQNGQLVEEEVTDNFIPEFKIPTIGTADTEDMKEMPQKKIRRGRPKKTRSEKTEKVLRKTYLKSDRFKTIEAKVLKLEHNLMVMTNMYQQTSLKMGLMNKAVTKITQTLGQLMNLRTMKTS